MLVYIKKYQLIFVPKILKHSSNGPLCSRVGLRVEKLSKNARDGYSQLFGDNEIVLLTKVKEYDVKGNKKPISRLVKINNVVKRN